MKVFVPEYYNKFSCIADKCKHNCCIGWEIDIDEETYEYYKSVKGNMGKRLAEGISEEEIPHFKLSDNERCPFLNERNLCDIIIELGEEHLCEICSVHPRFKNFYDTRMEIGIGMCCEEAGRIILTYPEKVSLKEVENDGIEEITSEEEQLVFELRDKLFKIIQNREITVNERIEKIFSEYDIVLPDKSISEWADFYLSLERMDESWTDRLNEMKTVSVSDENIFMNEEWENAFEQLFVYFIYRHFADGMYDGSLSERIAFAVVSVNIIRALCGVHFKLNGTVKIDDLVEAARCYSSEIEYSEENTERLLLEISIN